MATWATSERLPVRVCDFFERRWSSWLNRPVLAPVNRGRVGWVGTLGTLFVLHGALIRVNTLGTLESDQYDYAPAEGCYSCDETVVDAGEAGLGRTTAFYWWAAHVTILLLLAFDVLRYSNVTSAAADALLSYQTAAKERRRKFAFLTLAVPFLHLTFWFYRPVRFGCCVATPKWEPFKERVNQLAFLLWVTGFILLGKSQDHGYFLMRTPPQDACVLFLLREHLICREDERHGGRSKARTGSLILMALGQGGGRPVAEERARLNDSDEASDDVV